MAQENLNGIKLPPMRVGVPRETWPGEHRVALIPSAAAARKKAGLEVVVDTDAGPAAGFPTSAYESAGASIASRRDVFATSDIVLQVRSTPAAPAVRKTGQTSLGL